MNLIAVLAGIVYIALLTLCIALGKAAARGDRLAELSRLPFRPRVVEPEPERAAAPVVPLPRDGGGRAA